MYISSSSYCLISASPQALSGTSIPILKTTPRAYSHSRVPFPALEGPLWVKSFFLGARGLSNLPGTFQGQKAWGAHSLSSLSSQVTATFSRALITRCWRTTV